MTKVERIYRSDIEEHVVTVDGREVATAHKLLAPRWSVKVGNRLLGIAPNEDVALLHLDRIADELRASAA